MNEKMKHMPLYERLDTIANIEATVDAENFDRIE